MVSWPRRQQADLIDPVLTSSRKIGPSSKLHDRFAEVRALGERRAPVTSADKGPYGRMLPRRWLNNEQAAADSANFIANVEFPNITADLTAPGTPWIYYGVSLCFDHIVRM